MNQFDTNQQRPSVSSQPWVRHIRPSAAAASVEVSMTCPVRELEVILYRRELAGSLAVGVGPI